MNPDSVEAIARAVLYEGYVLWPYRRSAAKNRRRWTFGGVYPPGFCEAAGEGDASEVRCEVLLEGDDRTRVDVEIRFLHLVRRQILAPDGSPVDRLEAGGELHLSWDEATERRVRTGGEDSEATLEIAGGEAEEPVPGGAGRIRRTWEPIRATLAISRERLDERHLRLSTRVANRSDGEGADRAEAQRRSLLSTHLVLSVRDGAFHSMADPPPELVDAARSCRNEGLWPALVGKDGARDTILASPLILEDHPRIAPESPGDHFDGCEIDQLLILSVLALTDDEKREMAASDPRARELLERIAGLGPEELRRLHGTYRPVVRRAP